MPSPYFDTNVYDHIDKGYIADSEIEAVRAAIACGQLIPYLSPIVVEEVLGLWEIDHEATLRKLALARDLVGFRRMLKPPFMLVEEAVRAYASGVSSGAPTLPRADRLFLEDQLNRIVDGRTPSREYGTSCRT
jgi:hypothetical protein